MSYLDASLSKGAWRFSYSATLLDLCKQTNQNSVHNTKRGRPMWHCEVPTCTWALTSTHNITTKTKEAIMTLNNFPLLLSCWGMECGCQYGFMGVVMGECNNFSSDVPINETSVLIARIPHTAFSWSSIVKRQHYIIQLKAAHEFFTFNRSRKPLKDHMKL